MLPVVYALVALLIAGGSFAGNALGLRALACQALLPTTPDALPTAPPPGASAVQSRLAPAGPALDADTIGHRLGPSLARLVRPDDPDAAASEGVGIVLSSTGLVITTENAIFQESALLARVGDRTYPVRLVGEDVGGNLALLQLQGASGLAAAPFGALADIPQAVGSPVVVLSDEDVGIIPAAALLGQLDTVGIADSGGWPGTPPLSLLEVEGGPAISTDRGPVVDASGRVLGLVVAGADNTLDSAIPSEKLLSDAALIASGHTDGTVTIGLEPTLGLYTRETDQFPIVVSSDGSAFGTPAACLGIADGDVIDSIDGTDVLSSVEFRMAVVRHRPGDRVRVAWTDAHHLHHAAAVRLVGGTGP
jgi:S1-C subfamily serine protease